MGAIKEVFVPDIGDFQEVDVIEVLVRPGDAIRPEQSLITVESDKATMEIPSPSSGRVKELRVKVGDKVSKGSSILLLEAGEAAAVTGDKRAPPKTDSARASSAAAGGDKRAPPKTDSAPASTAAKTLQAAPGAAQKPQPPADAPARPSSAGGAARDVTVPDIGDFKDVEVIEILVKKGDAVAKEQSLITLESDKATMEIPSPVAGVVKEIKVKVGDKVAKGSTILSLEAGPERSQTPPQPERARPARQAAAAQEPAAEPAVPVSRAPDARPPVSDLAESAAHAAMPQSVAAKPHASPSVRKFARELGVDLALVDGSGPKERITQADVQAFVKKAMQRPTPAGGAGSLELRLPAWPQVDFAKFGPIETKPLSRIKKLSGPYLHRNWVSIPHVTQFDEADITELEAFRKDNAQAAEKEGVKLTMLAFLVKASVTALHQFPECNASLDAGGESLVIKKYFHIGVAVDTPDGLVVPVLRDADRKGVLEIARELAELSKAAREKKLKPGDMQGGTFSISSLGGIGGTAFTPIINAPEVAILGVSRSQMRPVYRDGQFVPRLILPFSLSYDHRVIDGAAAARFTSYLASVLSDIRRTLL
jgi:pyruvate dehydrogenase E2 component (dihydrolipoamide acetyltransferase)